MNERNAWFEVGDPVGAALRTVAAVAAVATLFAIPNIVAFVYISSAFQLAGFKDLVGGGASIFSLMMSAGSAFTFAATGRHLWARRWVAWAGVGLGVMLLAFGEDRLMDAFDPSRDWPW